MLRGNMKAGYRRILTAIISFGLIFVVWQAMGIYLETNDDRYIASILSGMLTGEPDAHTIYVNYLLCLPLMLLYRITTAVPWYGGMLIFFQWISYWGILDSACSRCKKWYQMVVVTGVTASFFGAFCYVVGMIQYTSTAAMLAAAGYACLILYEKKSTKMATFFLLELMACLLRSESMLLLLPLGVIAVWGLIFFGCEIKLQEKIRQTCMVCGTLLLVIVIALLGDAIGYHGDGWKHYHRFNDARTAMFDYYGKPTSEEVGNILAQYGVSAARYNAFFAYTILDDWSEDIECIEEVKDYSQTQYEQKQNISVEGLLKSVWNGSIRNFEWNINKVLLAAWLIFWVFVLLGRHWKMSGVGVGLFLVRTILWTWMYWRGRTPLRVTLPLMVGETLLLLALVWVNVAKSEKTVWLKGVLLGCCAIFCLASVDSAKMQYRYIKKENAAQQTYIEGLKELMQYCNERGQNRYLIESGALRYYKGSALESAIYRPINAIVSGGWFSASPIIQQHIDRYLGSAEDGIYVIVYNDGSQENQPMMLYLEEEMNTKPVLADRFTVSFGGEYAVYYFEGAFPVK